MISSINSALSGLNAAAKRLEVSAGNVANQFSTKSSVNGESVNKPYTPQNVQQVSLQNGGVSIEVKDAENPTQKLFSPDDPAADEYGFLEMPNVDLADEVIKQKLATYDFKANLKTLKAADEMEQSLLDILS